MQNYSKQCRTTQSDAKQFKAMQINPKRCKAIQSNAKQCKTTKSYAKQQSNAHQGEAMRSHTRVTFYMLFAQVKLKGRILNTICIGLAEAAQVQRKGYILFAICIGLAKGSHSTCQLHRFSGRDTFYKLFDRFCEGVTFYMLFVQVQRRGHILHAIYISLCYILHKIQDTRHKTASKQRHRRRACYKAKPFGRQRQPEKSEAVNITH